MSVITISMLTMTLMTVDILLVLNVVAQQAIGLVEDKVEVSVYFQDYVEQETVDGAVSYLRSLSQVRDVETITAQEAYDQFVARHVNDEEIMASLQELGENPFGPTLVVKANKAADFEVILDALENPQFRDDIRDKDFSDYEQIVERIRTTTDRIQTFGVALSVIFLLIAILIVFNTVRIGIFIHREEIGIMRLVGASNGFIKAPFYLEMILMSFIALTVTLAILFPVLSVLEPQFGVYFGTESAGLMEYFTQNGLMIFGVEFLGLVTVSIFSTILAMRRFLRV